MTSQGPQPKVQSELPHEFDQRARIAIDLGAESCRVSLLRWHNSHPTFELIHRIPNGPVQDGNSLRWPLGKILSGLDVGLRKAAISAPEGIASIAVDGWAVDYVRLNQRGQLLGQPFCYRDERSVRSKDAVDQIVPPHWMFVHTGAQPLRINTIYQLLADVASGIDPHAPWVCLPEYVLYYLGGRRVAEFTNATHTGLVDLETGNWSEPLLRLLNIPADSLPPIAPTGAVIGKLQGPLTDLAQFRDTATNLARLPRYCFGNRRHPCAARTDCLYLFRNMVARWHSHAEIDYDTRSNGRRFH